MKGNFFKYVLWKNQSACHEPFSLLAAFAHMLWTEELTTCLALCWQFAVFALTLWAEVPTTAEPCVYFVVKVTGI